MPSILSSRKNASILFVFLTLLLSFATAHAAGTDKTLSAPIFIAGFDEPLIAIGGASSAQSLVYPPATTVDHSDVTRLKAFIRLNQDTKWEASLQLNLGLAYLK